MNRAEWLAMLAKLTTPHDPVKALQAMLAYSPFLADLPPAAFTPASVEHVAMQPRRLAYPDLSEVKGPLQAWWREHQPRRPALTVVRNPEPARPEPTPEERAAVAQAMREALAALKPPPEPQARQPQARYAPPDVLAQARADLARRSGQ